MVGNRIRVLHVDDHADYVDMPASQLEQVDDRLVVDVVDTVADARAELRDGDVDCVVMEYHLLTDDEQPVDRIRAENGSIPVVLFTEAGLQTVAPALEDGPTEYVAKGGASNETTYTLLAERIVRLVETSRPDPEDGPSLQAAAATVGDGLALPACVLVGDEPTFVNEAFAARFDVEGTPTTVEELARVGGDDRGALAAFLTDPDAGRFTFEDGDGSAVVVHATVDEESQAVAAFWVDGDDESVAIEETMVDSLLANAPFALAFKDARGRYVRASDSLPRVAGDGSVVGPEGKVHHTAADLQGKTDYDLYAPERAASMAADDDRVVETGDPVVRTTDRRGAPDEPDGKVVDEIDETEIARSTTKLPWYDADGQTRGVVEMTEVTEIADREAAVDRQTDRLRDVERAVRAGLADPLARTRDAVSMAEERGDEGRLASARDALESMAEDVDTVRQLARFGQPPAELAPVDVGDVAATVWSHLDAPDASLENTTTTVTPADRTRLGHLFERVFENSLEHGGPAVTVSVGDLADGFVVTDDGPGVDVDEYERLLAPGYSSTDDATGLGLAVVAAIAESFGWDVAVTEGAAGGVRLEFTGLDSTG